MEKKKRLCELCVGECGRVHSLVAEGSMRRRFLDVGIAPGTVVFCVGKSPFGDPCAYFVRGCEIAIRRTDARKVILE